MVVLVGITMLRGAGLDDKAADVLLVFVIVAKEENCRCYPCKLAG